MSEQDRPFLKQLPLGPMDNFVYLVGDPATHTAAAIDPAWDAAAMVDAARAAGYAITAIWLTHGHYDHTNAVADLLAAVGDVPVYLSRQMPAKWRPAAAILVELDDGDTVSVGDVRFTALHTPGHSPDGLCFLHDNILIAGDTLFIDGCGRCDLPDSDVDAMYESIHGRLMRLPDETVIYPGHDYGPKPFDTLGNQKRTNRFMLASTREAFIHERMG